jgi:hypothetical protein
MSGSFLSILATTPEEQRVMLAEYARSTVAELRLMRSHPPLVFLPLDLATYQQKILAFGDYPHTQTPDGTQIANDSRILITTERGNQAWICQSKVTREGCKPQFRFAYKFGSVIKGTLPEVVWGPWMDHVVEAFFAYQKAHHVYVHEKSLCTYCMENRPRRKQYTTSPYDYTDQDPDRTAGGPPAKERFA